MSGDIGIVVESRANPPRFRLAATGGSVPAVAFAVVTDSATLLPLWCIAARRYQEEVGVHFIEPSTGEARDELDPDELTFDPVEDLPPDDPRHQAALLALVPSDSIEDLPPSDPRHQAALRRMLLDQATLMERLDVVTYGVVPPGFVQVHPPDGSVVALRAQTSYAFSVDALGEHGIVVFELDSI
jgi:hypothetical protein